MAKLEAAPQPSHRLRTVLACMLAVTAVAVLIAQQVQWASVPTKGEWAEAASFVVDHSHEGDHVLVEPAWDSRPRTSLGGLPYIPAARPTWFDTATARRVWLVSETGRIDRGLARLGGGWTVTERHPFGSISALAAAPDTSDPTLWDIFDALGQAKVRRWYDGKPQACERWTTRPHPRWDCGRPDPFLYVGETLRVVTNDFHRCLWAMPIDRGGTLTLSFAQVPLGTKLKGFYGQPIDAVRSRRGSPVTFSVWIDGEQRHTKTFALSEEGFLPFSIDTGGPGSTMRGDVVFKVRADSQLDRFFCFAARTTR